LAFRRASLEHYDYATTLKGVPMQLESQAKSGERRRIRSNDPHRALALQLSHVRHSARLDALVLATHDGLPIAHAGDAALCRELAALAPILSRGTVVANEIDIRQGLLFVRAVIFQGSPLYLASCGDNPTETTPAEVDQWLAEATQGVTRILAA
jgi:hypothetical protein